MSAKEDINIVNLFVDLAAQLPLENPFKKKGGMHSLKDTKKVAKEEEGGMCGC